MLPLIPPPLSLLPPPLCRPLLPTRRRALLLLLLLLHLHLHLLLPRPRLLQLSLRRPPQPQPQRTDEDLSLLAAWVAGIKMPPNVRRTLDVDVFCRTLTFAATSPDEAIVTQADDACAMFIVYSGECTMYSVTDEETGKIYEGVEEDGVERSAVLRQLAKKRKSEAAAHASKAAEAAAKGSGKPLPANWRMRASEAAVSAVSALEKKAEAKISSRMMAMSPRRSPVIGLYPEPV